MVVTKGQLPGYATQQGTDESQGSCSETCLFTLSQLGQARQGSTGASRCDTVCRCHGFDSLSFSSSHKASKAPGPCTYARGLSWAFGAHTRTSQARLLVRSRGFWGFAAGLLQRSRLQQNWYNAAAKLNLDSTNSRISWIGPSALVCTRFSEKSEENPAKPVENETEVRPL